MRNKFFFILILILGFNLSNAWAQTTPMPVKTISGGILNGKALRLVKPSFPAAAKAVGANGAVNVQVIIDEEGNVISANAVSGHPLLRQVCEQAARESKFAPTRLSDQPVKVTGVIVYNFVTPMTVTQLGYELSLAELSQSVTKSQISSISGSFPKSWEEEREILKNLDSSLISKPIPEKSPEALSTNTKTDSLNPPNGTFTGPPREGIATRIGSVGVIRSDENYSINRDGIALINDLQSKIENRLSVNEKVLWSYRLGKNLGKLKAEINNEERMRANISELNQLDSDAPTGVPEYGKLKIRELVEVSQQTIPIGERIEKLNILIENLRNLRTY